MLWVRALVRRLDTSAGAGKLCILGHLGLVFIWSCFVSCLLFLLFYVSLRNLFSGTCRKIPKIASVGKWGVSKRYALWLKKGFFGSKKHEKTENACAMFQKWLARNLHGIESAPLLWLESSSLRVAWRFLSKLRLCRYVHGILAASPLVSTKPKNRTAKLRRLRKFVFFDSQDWTFLRWFLSKRTRHRFPMKLGMLLVRNKEIIKT